MTDPFAGVFDGLDDQGPRRPPGGDHWLVFETDRYLADHGADALAAAFAELAAVGLAPQPMDDRDDAVWVEGPKPPRDIAYEYVVYLQPPNAPGAADFGQMVTRVSLNSRRS